MRKRFIQGFLIQIKHPCSTLGLIIIIGGAMFAWVLRDGLGPDSYESSGLDALSHFLFLFALPAFIGFLLLLCGFFINRKTSPRISRKTLRNKRK